MSFRACSLRLFCVVLLVVGLVAVEAQTRVFAESSAYIEEVVVTARRREESLQDVPLSVQSFDQQTLESRAIFEIRDLEQVAPGVQIQPGTFRDTNPQTIIRGFPPGAGQIDSDPTAPFIINEVPLQTAQGQNAAFFDIESVQVLKGPQGTLQGRNTVGGAVLITTRRPDFDGVSGYIRGGYGSFDQTLGEGVLNLPLGDRFALRIGARQEKQHGTWTNVADDRRYDDRDNLSLRASALFKITDTLENLTVFDRTTHEVHGSAIVFQAKGFDYNDPSSYPGSGTVIPPDPNCGAGPACVAFHNIGIMLAPGFAAAMDSDAVLQKSLGERKFDAHLTAANSRFGVAPFENVRNWGVSNTTTWEASDILTVKNIFGYRKLNRVTYQNIDGTSFGASVLSPFLSGTALLDTMQSLELETITEELQVLGSTDGGIKWVGGIFYQHYEGHDNSDSVQFGGRFFNVFNIEAESIAVYGQVDIPLAEQLTLTAGLRYSWDDRDVVYGNLSNFPISTPRAYTGKYGQNINLPEVTNPFTDPGAQCNFNRQATSDRVAFEGVNPDCTVPVSKKDDAPSWNVTLTYDATDDVMLYLAHRRGYRAGFLSGRATTFDATENNKETVYDVELGIKSDLILGEMPVRFNAAAYRSWYTNIAVSIPKIDEATGLPINAAENSGKATLYGGEAGVDILPVDGLTLSGGVGYVFAEYDEFPDQTVETPLGTPIIFYPGEGRKFGHPRWTFNLGARYEFALGGNAGEMALSLSYFYSGDRPDASTAAPKRFSIQEAYGVLGARVDWRNIFGSPVHLALWGKNLTDEDYLDGVFSFEDAAGFRSGFPADPRMLGATLTIDFGS